MAEELNDNFHILRANANCKFFAVSLTPDVAIISDDGSTWLAATSGGIGWTSIAYGNEAFVALGTGTLSELAAITYDGINWAAVCLTGLINWSSIAYGNGKFVAIANNSKYYATSEDGITWTNQTFATTPNIQTISYVNDLFVIFSGDKILTSIDGVNWISYTATDANYGIAYGNGPYVGFDGGGPNGSVITSNDSVNWTNSIIGGYTNSIQCVAFGNGKFVAMERAGSFQTSRALYSTDGVAWTFVDLDFEDK